MKKNHSKKGPKGKNRTIWASFQNNKLEEELEPASEQINPDGSVTATKTFIVVQQARFDSEKTEFEFEDVREAWNEFARICFLDFCDQLSSSFYAHDSAGDPYDFDLPKSLKSLRSLARKLEA